MSFELSDQMAKVELTAHLCIDPTADPSALVRMVSARLEETHQITHTTLQCEVGRCPNPSDEFHGDAVLARVPDSSRPGL